MWLHMKGTAKEEERKRRKEGKGEEKGRRDRAEGRVRETRKRKETLKMAEWDP